MDLGVTLRQARPPNVRSPGLRSVALSPVEVETLVLRYGLADGDVQTISEVASQLDRSGFVIQKRIRDAFKIFRNPFHINSLRYHGP